MNVVLDPQAILWRVEKDWVDSLFPNFRRQLVLSFRKPRLPYCTTQRIPRVSSTKKVAMNMTILKTGDPPQAFFKTKSKSVERSMKELQKSFAKLEKDLSKAV